MLVAELFYIPAQPQTFDGWTHLLTINGFYRSLADGNFPVAWIDGVANYGSPLGQIAHQTTAYLGAAFYFITHSTVVSYNLVMLTGAILSAVGMFVFLRLHVSTLSAFLGAFLFIFSPYRIFNIYIRGGLPEFFASAIIPLVLLSLHILIKKRRISGFFMLVISCAVLVLTHPMMPVLTAFLAGAYVTYLCWGKSRKFWLVTGVVVGVAAIQGMLLAAYYLIPLKLESKYLYYGANESRNVHEQFQVLGFSNYLQESWGYSSVPGNGVRTPQLQLGIIEMGILIVAVFVYGFTRREKSHAVILARVLILAAGIYILFSSVLTQPLYQRSTLLSSLQFPWRMLTGLLFIPPTLLALMHAKLQHQRAAVVIVVLVVVTLRFPQLYGKNYVQYPESRYSFGIVNPHNANMNTVWMGQTWDYPIEAQKGAIIEGTGTITERTERNGLRKYQVTAQSDIRMVDYTFYFPGWKLLVDGSEHPMEFQDPEYRGVITYRLPAGNHSIELTYADTRLRLLAKLISIGAIVICIAQAVFLYMKHGMFATKVATWYRKSE